MESHFSGQKCSKLPRMGNKFGVDDGLGLEWVQKEAQSLTFFKIAAASIFSFSPYKQCKLPKIGATFLQA